MHLAGTNARGGWGMHRSASQQGERGRQFLAQRHGLKRDATGSLSNAPQVIAGGRMGQRMLPHEARRVRSSAEQGQGGDIDPLLGGARFQSWFRGLERLSGCC